MSVYFAYFGHHKCGTQWIRGILERASKNLGFNLGYFHHPNCFGGNLSEFVSQNNMRLFAYVNADYEKIDTLHAYRGFHVVRDPRDVVVSAYFSHLFSHHLSKEWAALTRHREQLQKVGTDEGLMLEIDFAIKNFTRMNNWNYADPNMLEVKFEDLLANETENFLRIFSFLGLFSDAFNRNDLAEILAAESFLKKTSGRKHGDEDQKHHYRKGISGDWENYFNEAHKDHFKSKYQFILEKLGYEKNDNW